MFYSATMRAFYDPNIHAEMPEDAREISDDAHAELLAGQAAGMIIASDGSGYPFLAARPVPSPEQALDEERQQMVVSRYQIRAALFSAGALHAADAAAEAGDPMVMFGWREAMTFRRDSQTIAAVAGHLGMAETDIDDLFRAAALVEG